jgi:dUTP pyrophosphatase
MIKVFGKLTRGSEHCSGYDLHAIQSISIPAGGVVQIGTGVHIEPGPNTEAQVRPRSGLSAKGIWVAFGTIDSDYRGEICVTMLNTTYEPYEISQGDRIAQLVFGVVFAPGAIHHVEDIGELSSTARGAKGFGSSGQ